MKNDDTGRIEALRALEAYEVTAVSRIGDLASTAVSMRHRKTGAQVLVMLNDDENKVFTIGFRTPAGDSTGVPHILEHSVLCGSRKYPCKDPFIELAKGSMNTFLNAMTYPDKTVYPVASCNAQDFRNLVDVYLDAVFHPNIYREEKIFRQEGWHYELESEDGELALNGVVYSEMKGVFSSLSGMMESVTGRILYEGHPYGEESGGDPDVIPELGYEDFLEFHRRYYHPSNSYIYLYGDADMASMLAGIDRDYLSEYDCRPTDSAIPDVRRWASPKELSVPYPISESESDESAAVLTVNTVVGGELDPMEYMGFSVLEYILLEVPGAPVREALNDAGIGDETGGGYMSGMRTPYFSIFAKNAQAGQKDAFLGTVKDTLRTLAEEGIDRRTIRAAINFMEFRAREADYGSMPKGLVYGLLSFDSWLYDADPTMHMRYGEIFARLKEEAENGFFEGLIRKYLLDNPHEAVITFAPVRGLTGERERLLKEKLEAVRSSLSPEELRGIVRRTQELKAYQSEPSSPEELRCIPMLSRSDIEPKAVPLVWEKRRAAGLDVIYSDIFTSGIVYLKLVFDLKGVPAEEIPYVSLLTEVLGYIDTKEHSYAQLATLTNLNSGGIGFSVDSYPDMDRPGESLFTFAANAKVLADKTDFALEMIRELLYESRLDDKERLKTVVAEVRARVKEDIQYAGHTTALNRAGAMCSKDCWFSDAVKGIGYYRMLESADIDEVSGILARLARRIFVKDRLLVDVIGDAQGWSAAEASMERYLNGLPAEPAEGAESCSGSAGTDGTAGAGGSGREYLIPVGKEAWTTAGMVNYVARFGNFRRHGYEYTGALQVLRVLLNYDYLWNSIRVLGGAYGCSSLFGNAGNAGFASYRDPNLTETDEVYRKIPDYIAAYDADEREMTKAVIGAMSTLDMPLTPLTKGLRALSGFLSHVSEEQRQRTRDEILQATPEKIRALAPLVRSVLEDGCVCALANAAGAEGSREFWTSVQPLLRD